MVGYWSEFAHLSLNCTTAKRIFLSNHKEKKYLKRFVGNGWFVHDDRKRTVVSQHFVLGKTLRWKPPSHRMTEIRSGETLCNGKPLPQQNNTPTFYCRPERADHNPHNHTYSEHCYTCVLIKPAALIQLSLVLELKLNKFKGSSQMCPHIQVTLSVHACIKKKQQKHWPSGRSGDQKLPLMFTPNIMMEMMEIFSKTANNLGFLSACLQSLHSITGEKSIVAKLI